VDEQLPNTLGEGKGIPEHRETILAIENK